jgi:hypothetical protein
MSNLVKRKIVGDKFYYGYPTPEVDRIIKIVNTTEYRTKGEDFILVKDIDSCKIMLDSSTTKHIIIKTMTITIISSMIGKIDEDYDEVRVGRGACVEFILIDNYWYIVSSDGLKLD